MTRGGAMRSAGDLARAARYATELLNRMKRDPRTHVAAEDCRQTMDGLKAGRCTPDEAATAVRARVHALVSDECGLPYQWLVELILHDITAEVRTGVAGVELEPPAVADIPKGRAPKRGGDYLARDIDWFFRDRVLHESVYAIAKADLGKVGKGHHAVQKAIARVRAALDTLDVRDDR